MKTIVIACLLSISCGAYAAPKTKTTKVEPKVTVTETIRYYDESNPGVPLSKEYVEYLTGSAFVVEEDSKLRHIPSTTELNSPHLPPFHFEAQNQSVLNADPVPIQLINRR